MPRMPDKEEWYSVTRTWYVKATDWYEATQATKRNGQEDDLCVARWGDTDPRWSGVTPMKIVRLA